MFRLSQKSRGFISVIGGFIIQFSCANFYIWGNLNLYFTSYYRHLDPASNLSPNLGVLTNPVLDMVASLSMFLAVPISHKLSPRLTSFLCGIAICLTFIIISFISSPYLFVVALTILMGTFNGIIWMTVLHNAFEYFPRKKGLCSGVILSGVGFGTFLGNFISRKSINPLNEEPIDVPGVGRLFSENISKNFPYGLRNLAIYYFTVIIIGSLLTFNHKDERETEVDEEVQEIEISKDVPKEPNGPKTEGQSSIKELNPNPLEENLIKKADQDTELSVRPEIVVANTKDAANELNPPQFSICEELRHLNPYLLFLVNVFSNAAIIFFAANFKNYGIAYIPNDEYLTLVGSAAGIANGIGRIFMGTMGDRFGFLKTLQIFHLVLFILIFTVDFIVVIKELYLVWNTIIYLILGGRVSLMPSVTYHLFGSYKGSRLFPYVNTGCCGYTVVLYILSFLAFLALVILLRIH